MLLGEQRRWDEQRRLPPLLHRFEDCPQGHLGLAEADIAEDEPVHRHVAFHVRLDVDDGGKLIDGLLIGKASLELALPRRVRLEPMSGDRGSLPMQLDHILSHDCRRLAHPAAGLCPVGTPQPRQPRALPAGVASYRSQLIRRDVQLVACCVLDQQVVTGGACHIAMDEPLESPDAVVVVDDEIAGVEIAIGLVGAVAPPRPDPAVRAAAPCDLPLPDDAGPDGRKHEPLMDA